MGQVSVLLFKEDVRRAHQHQAAAAGVKRVGLKKNLIPRTTGNISVYFNSKMIPIFQAMSHLDELREYFCSLILAGTKSQRLWNPQQLLPSHPNASQHRNHQHHNTGLDSASQEKSRRKNHQENQFLITVWVEICSRLVNRGDASILFSKKAGVQVAEHLTGTRREGKSHRTALGGFGRRRGRRRERGREGKRLQTEPRVPIERVLTNIA